MRFLEKCDQPCLYDKGNTLKNVSENGVEKEEAVWKNPPLSSYRQRGEKYAVTVTIWWPKNVSIIANKYIPFFIITHRQYITK